MKKIGIFLIAAVLITGIIGSAPGCGGPQEPSTQTISGNFSIEGDHSVPFQQFNVLTPGLIEAGVEWTGESDELEVTIEGPRRPELSDPTEPYATASGTSPLSLSYEVTESDIARGVSWTLVVRDPTGNWDAALSINLVVPFDDESAESFRWEKVGLSSGDIWPSQALYETFLEQLATTSEDGLHAIITLTEALDGDNGELLEEAGVSCHSPLLGLHYRGFVYTYALEQLDDPEVADLIGFITPLEPGDKIDPHILLANYAKYQVIAEDGEQSSLVLNPDSTLNITVIFGKTVTSEAIDAILDDLAISHQSINECTRHVILHPERLVELAAHDAVQWIDVGFAPHLPDNDYTREYIGVEDVQDAIYYGPPPSITYNGFAGEGIVAGVREGRIHNLHPDLNVIVNIGQSFTVSGHATHVAGILAGSGIQSSLEDDDGNPNGGYPFQWRGMAPRAELISAYNLEDDWNLEIAINDYSLDLITRSQSFSYDGDYSTENGIIDRNIGVAADVTRLPYVISAGNDGESPVDGAEQIGYFSLTKQVKNGIIVGNWDAHNDRLYPSSSLGPAYDGRIKPDVVAPGTDVWSTSHPDTWPPQTRDWPTNGYAEATGTSMSAPAVAGVLALLLEGWQVTYNEPLGMTMDDNRPLPSTLRAIIMQTADDIIDPDVRGTTSADVDDDGSDGHVTATAGPDFATGWGLVNTQAAMELILDSHMEDDEPVPSRIIEASLSQGDICEYQFTVEHPGIPYALPDIRITLAWDDLEADSASTDTAPKLVNDLDLELEGPDGTVYYPWLLGHRTVDRQGNEIAPEDHLPGMVYGRDYLVENFINPVANPQHRWYWWDVNDDIPQDALEGDGVWVATTGRDHLNNGEQVFIENAQPGVWTARVIGFSVGSDVEQDFSVVTNFEVTPPSQYDLTVMSTTGGSVTTPEEGTHTYNAGAEVDLVATADPGYYFIEWTGDNVDTIADVYDSSTTITMNDNYSITANFEEEGEEPIYFPDANLEAAIREAIDKPTGDIYPSDLVGLTEFDAHRQNIADLTGLEHCTSLTNLRLYDNEISDVSPLANLTDLDYLSIWSNQIGDIWPLANLTNLTGLRLYGNEISDVSPLVNLTNLTNLELNWNQILDISPLAGLTYLTELYLDGNQISDVSPLAGLINLTDLDLGFNEISSISALSDLTNLEYLDLNFNEISDISVLANITNLKEVHLQSNQVSNVVPLTNLTSLTELNLGSNQISDISALTNLTNLIDLSLMDNPIGDFSVLSNLTELEHLYLSFVELSDFSMLANLTNLTYLSLAWNNIIDISPLLGLTNLVELHLGVNEINDISTLAYLPNLTELDLFDNQIADILPLVENDGLAAGDFIDLRANPLSDDSINIYIPELEARGVDVDY